MIETVAQVKRFFERWQADPEFKEQLFVNPHQAMKRYKFASNLDGLSFLWDSNFHEKPGNSEKEVRSLIKYLKEFIEQYAPIEIRKELLQPPEDPRFKAWWERQTARVDSISEPGTATIARAYPLSFELSQGCSVGCWFCGVSAPHLSKVFVYTDENKKLWKEVLKLMKQVLGPIASSGLCYHATDPFDNADYEKFCIDFYEILGTFPQTTTALAIKDPSRTRNFLNLSHSKGQKHNRFSILSLKMLKQVHEEFSPEELAFTSLGFRHKEVEDNESKVKSGRARTRYRNQVGNSYDEAEDLSEGSISTTMGFLINMVELNIKLISPCVANDRWTEGYRIHLERSFTNASHLKTILNEILENHMPITVEHVGLIRFRSDLKYESFADGFQVSTRFKIFKFRNNIYAQHLGELVQQGNKTAQEISIALSAWDMPAEEVFKSLNLLFKLGILDDEPTLN